MSSDPTAIATGALASVSPDEVRFLEGLIHGIRCGVLAIDSGGRVAMMNQPARRILGLAEAPCQGLPVAEVLSRQPSLVRLLLDTSRMSSLPNRAELALEGVDKTIGFTVSLVGSTRDDAEEPMGVAMFFKDLTQIEQREEHERLRDRLVALGQMTASMAHEIRNPLASIDVSCKLLGRRLGDETACRDLLDKITAEVRRLDRSVTSSLEFVRPVTLTLGLNRIEPVLDEAVAVAAGRRGRAGIRIERTYGSGLPAFLMDRNLIRQVMVNLVLNAMEAVGETGQVTVGLQVIDAPDVGSTVPYAPAGQHSDPWGDVRQYVEIQVADTGVGIADEERDHIFHPFFTTKKNGSGVGLAMARKIVGSHRGSIVVESTPGQGAEFHVRLPMVVQSAAEVVSE